MTPKPDTARTLTALTAAGFALNIQAPYGQTYEVWCRRGDLRGCVLVVSTRAGRLIRASTWEAREREVSVRGLPSQIGLAIRAFARAGTPPTLQEEDLAMTTHSAAAPNGCVPCNLTFATPAEVVAHVLADHAAPDEGPDATGADEYLDDPSLQDPAYLAYLAAEEARGELAGYPDTMGCYECGGFDGVTAPERKLIKLGPVIEQHRDPTQTYVLECGHLAI